MPYKYIGRTHDFKGKTLWELLGNLKNFGVGRLVVRSRMERYPEPCYLRILKVETLPEPQDVSMDNLRKCKVLVESTFRGKLAPKPILLERTTYKTDYRLIPKDEEAKYCEFEAKPTAERVLPRTMEFPSLLKELVIRDIANSGSQPTKKDLELEISYKTANRFKRYRIAEEGEEPTEKVEIGLGNPVAPRLYEGIKI